MTECWRRFPNPFPALVLPHQPPMTDLLVLIVLRHGGAVDVDGGEGWALDGAHMPKMMRLL